MGSPRARAISETGGYELAILATCFTNKRRISETVPDRTTVAIDH